MPTKEQLMNALRQADAAGDTQAAQRFAQMIREQGGRFDGIKASNTSNAMSSFQAGVSQTKQRPGVSRQQQRQDDADRARAKRYAKNPILAGITGASNSVGSTLTGLADITGLTKIKPIGDFVDRTNRMMSIENEELGMAGKIGYAGGEIAQAAIPVSKAAAVSKAVASAKGATSLVARVTPYIGNAAIGAGQAGIKTPEQGQTRLGNAAFGAGAGVVGQGVAGALGKVVTSAGSKIAPEVRALVDKAAAHGIRVTPAQVSNSTALKTARSVAGKFPLSGARGVAEQQQQQFNRAVAKTFGENADAVTPEVYAAAKTRIGQQFNELTQRNNLKLDPAFMGKLKAVRDEALLTGDDTIISAIDRNIDRLINSSNAGVVPGRAYQSFDTTLGNIMKGSGEKAHYVGNLREAVRGQMDNSISAADQEAWGLARGQYRNMKTIRDLAAKADESGISPGQLMGRMNSTGAGKESMAMGARGELGDLARIGSRFLKDPIPNSGTADRGMWQGALGTSVLGLPALASGITGARLTRATLDSPLLLKYMLRDNAGRIPSNLARFAQPVARPMAIGLGTPSPAYLTEEELYQSP